MSFLSFSYFHNVLNIFGEKAPAAEYRYTFKYDFDYAEQAKEQDVEQDFGKFKLWVCPESAGYLDGMVIGWERDGLNEGFHFWNPMESSSCGCGVSVGF